MRRLLSARRAGRRTAAHGPYEGRFSSREETRLSSRRHADLHSARSAHHDSPHYLGVYLGLTLGGTVSGATISICSGRVASIAGPPRSSIQPRTSISRPASVFGSSPAAVNMRWFRFATVTVKLSVQRCPKLR